MANVWNLIILNFSRKISFVKYYFCELITIKTILWKSTLNEMTRQKHSNIGVEVITMKGHYTGVNGYDFPPTGLPRWLQIMRNRWLWSMRELLMPGNKHRHWNHNSLVYSMGNYYSFSLLICCPESSLFSNLFSFHMEKICIWSYFHHLKDIWMINSKRKKWGIISIHTANGIKVFG